MKFSNINNGNTTNRVWSGLILLVIGVVFFLRNFGIEIPDWILSWHTLLIAIGLFIGVKRNFQGGGWLIMVLIGGYFTIEDMGDFDFSKYFLAFIFILLGLFLILKPKTSAMEKWKRKSAKLNFQDQTDAPANTEEPVTVDQNDVIDSVNIFGGAHQKVYSKNFKGGDVLAIFGGCELNLSHADFQDTITLDVIAIFGGVKIIVPPNWEIKSEIVAIFGGMDDKRAVAPFVDGPRKILVIKGVAMFGGVDVKNY
ncbi:LiaF transmembrane domain-containing protein [Pedobacter sp.]|uniref:LiaF transmembrane domain-containing protein n=1 Tax=Pedobacter sp. TaxID=1411316 RepID=UPI003D7F2FD8